jgi:hypothetical protein
MDGFIRHFAELKTWMTGPRPAMTMGHGPAMTVNRMGFGWQVLVFERDRPDWNHLFGRTVIARSEAVAGLDPAKQSGAERARSSRLLRFARNDSGDRFRQSEQ